MNIVILALPVLSTLLAGMRGWPAASGKGDAEYTASTGIHCLQDLKRLVLGMPRLMLMLLMPPHCPATVPGSRASRTLMSPFFSLVP